MAGPRPRHTLAECPWSKMGTSTAVPRMGMRLLQTMLVMAVFGKLMVGAAAVPARIRIGGIFTHENKIEEEAFKFAVMYVNEMMPELLPRTRIDYIINRTMLLPEFVGIQAVCHQARSGVVAIIGPGTSSGVKFSNAVCSGLHIPHIAPIATDPTLANPEFFPYLLRMSAPDSVQSRALVDLVTYFGWTHMAILTSSDDYGIHGLVEFQAIAARKKWGIVSVQQFQTGNDVKSVNATSQLKYIVGTGVRVVILNCLAQHATRVLQQAEHLGMTRRGWAWVVTDGVTTKNTTYLTSPVPSYLQGLIGTDPDIAQGTLLREVRQVWENADRGRFPHAGQFEVESNFGQFFDAVLAIAHALDNIFRDGHHIEEEKLDCCEEKRPWKYGKLVLEYLKKVEEDGVMRRLRFSGHGHPNNPSYGIMNLLCSGWKKVGSWSEDTRLIMHNPPVRFMGGADSVVDYVSDLMNRTLRVVTIEEPPFIFYSEKDEHGRPRKGNDRFYGFCKDMLEHFSKHLGFKYEMYMVEDKNFGARDPVTGKWNGMVRDLVVKKADVAAASFTISYEREQDIDFTKPYIDIGLTFVLSNQIEKEDRPFKFLDVFEPNLWLFILLSTLAVSFFISLVNKLSPSGYHGHFVQEEEPTLLAEEEKPAEIKEKKKEMIGMMSLNNALYFAVASLLFQGGDILPKSGPGRITASLWWLVTVIIVATYTANLAAFLTVSRMDTDINSVEDLVSQKLVQYGTVQNSQPLSFFESSSIHTFETMARYMKVHSTLTMSSRDGIEKAREERYAFIWDSAVLDYVVKQPPCNLRTVGRLFGKIGFGFGLQKGSAYTDAFSIAILQARESGYLDKLKEKWYTGECHDQNSATTVTNDKMDVSKLLGVFYIIYVGMAVSVVVLIVEWVVACMMAVDQTDPEAPKTFLEAFRRRLAILERDIEENWFPTLAKRRRKQQEQKNNVKKRSFSRSSSKSGDFKNSRSAGSLKINGNLPDTVIDTSTKV
ncbi:glutamate receptor 2-like isoform X1 [Branchiostoma floridae x Branchiostoma japonicum]